MPAILTNIVEGPREDGRVRFHCDSCGNVTNWILPPEPGHQTLHYCAPSEVAAIRKANGAIEPCATSHLNAAIASLRGASAKILSCHVKAGIEETLKKLPQWIREAAKEEISEGQRKRDLEDGINGSLA